MPFLPWRYEITSLAVLPGPRLSWIFWIQNNEVGLIRDLRGGIFKCCKFRCLNHRAQGNPELCAYSFTSQGDLTGTSGTRAAVSDIQSSPVKCPKHWGMSKSPTSLEAMGPHLAQIYSCPRDRVLLDQQYLWQFNTEKIHPENGKIEFETFRSPGSLKYVLQESGQTVERNTSLLFPSLEEFEINMTIILGGRKAMKENKIPLYRRL